MDLHWITNELALGGRIPEDSALILPSQGIRAVVDLREEMADEATALHHNGIRFLHLPTPDLQAIPQEMLWMGVRFIGDEITSGRKILVHCEHGIGRSALLVCCALVSFGHTPLTALLHVKNIREKISPSPDQLTALLTWSQDWFDRAQRIFPHVQWEDLAAIAYRSPGIMK